MTQTDFRKTRPIFGELENRRLDEFSRNRSGPCPGNLPIRVQWTRKFVLCNGKNFGEFREILIDYLEFLWNWFRKVTLAFGDDRSVSSNLLIFHGTEFFDVQNFLSEPKHLRRLPTFSRPTRLATLNLLLI